MDLKVAAVLLVLCATVTITEGAIPKCCVATTKLIPPHILRKVDKFDVQTSHGTCEIDALILHVKGKKYCAHPDVKRILRQVQRNRREKQRVKLDWITKR
ncbi:hypothetical protein MATL_G00084420 [Megalops atlanticus]|uniref:Chemokine interleukin-8-like domain-containing protein n=1 Tax=Megalops atlanticus TaxID=7932 RepID=A0A9D3T769_MEGAT|nr:hypothetical protein MATL_G00084420 [Megalops atlanticus]